MANAYSQTLMGFQLFDKEISGPFTIPSGVMVTKPSMIRRLFEIPEIGIVTTKSISFHKKQGNREPIIAEYGFGSFINAVGLENPGAVEFAKQLKKIKIPDDRFLLASVFGRDEKEFALACEELLNYVDGFELNISCPHSTEYGLSIGKDLALVKKIVEKVSSLQKPVFVKLPPTVDVEATVTVSMKAGARGITAINSEGPKLSPSYEGIPILFNKFGGVSGKAILDLGVSVVKKVRRVTRAPIIACGGISTARDVLRYSKAGANFYGIGSALAGMKHAEVKEYFHALYEDVVNGTNNAESYLKKNLRMSYEKFKVEHRRLLANDLFIIQTDKSIKAEPGQFVFVMLPGIGEKPFSVLDDEPLSLLVKIRGKFTKALHSLKKGDHIYVRGPYGNSLNISKSDSLLLVGGGTGIAALYLFAKRNNHAVAVLGASDYSHLAYVDEFEKECQEVYKVTETGEIGVKGLVTDLLDDVIEKHDPKYCINCGPEPMVRQAIKKESKTVPLERIYSSIEMITKCGIGLCGSCVTSQGYRSCVDGTFFNPQDL